ncbi:MAG: hypothetical protein V1659_02600 [Candidatus Woesearchaeota archaeon]
MLGKIIALLLVFALGFLVHILLASTEAGRAAALAESPSGELIAPELPSPGDRIAEKDVLVYDKGVVISIENPEQAMFADTNSMDPVLDTEATAIQIRPESMDDVNVGDIISYRSAYADGITIHRVVHKGKDSQGEYVIAKGDNVALSDPGKIRFEQIEKVLVAIIY